MAPAKPVPPNIDQIQTNAIVSKIHAMTDKSMITLDTVQIVLITKERSLAGPVGLTIVEQKILS